MPDNIQQNILDLEKRGEAAYRQFVEERICGDKNLWDSRSKVPAFGWTAATRLVRGNTGSTEMNLKASSTMMAHLLVIARSSRDIDLKYVIGKHEFSATNRMLMTPEGKLHPCCDKAQLIHKLTDLVKVNMIEEHPSEAGADEPVRHQVNQASSISSLHETCVLYDGMAIVQEQAVFKANIKTCKDLATHGVDAINIKSHSYASTYVVFDNYSVPSSLKASTRKRRTKRRSSHIPEYQVDDNTPIKDFSAFLGSSKTKDLLTIYLAQKLVQKCTTPVTTVTRLGILSNHMATNTVDFGSNQEEADTLIILYEAKIHKLGTPVHLYSPDTDVLVLALSALPHLGDNATMIMGTGLNRHFIPLLPIYTALGERRVLSLRGFHALSGCDTTSRILGKSKTAWWNAFVTASDRVIQALIELGVGDEPCVQVLSGCEEFICQLFSSKKHTFSRAADLRWHFFCKLKPNQGVEKLPPTQGAMHEHIRRAHLQCSMWQQVLTACPSILEPTKLGWSQERAVEELTPVLTRVPLAPKSVLEMVKCGCVKSFCSGHCSCKNNNLPCTELCACEADPDNCPNNADDDVADSDLSDIEV